MRTITLNGVKYRALDESTLKKETDEKRFINEPFSDITRDECDKVVSALKKTNIDDGLKLFKEAYAVINSKELRDFFKNSTLEEISEFIETLKLVKDAIDSGDYEY